MASYASNPYYDDPFLTQAASNIAKIFIDPNPGRTATQRAQARLYTLQGDKLDRETQKRSSIANAFRAMKGGVITPEQFDAITGDAIEGDLKPSDIAGMTLYRQSNSGQPVSAVGRAFVGAGHAIGKDQGLSVEDREAVAKRDNDEAARRSAISAGPGYAAVAESRRYHDGELAFKEKTRFDKETNVPEGSAVFFTPGDPRFEGKAEPGSVPAPRKDKDRFGVSPNGDGSFSYRTLENGVPAPTPSSEKDRYVESQDENGNSVWRKATEGIPGPAPKAIQDRFVESEDPEHPGRNIYVKPREGVAGKATKPSADKFVVVPNGDGTFSYQPVSPGLQAPAPASEKDKYVQSEDPNNPGKNVYTRAREGAPGPAREPKPEMKVNGKELDSMELSALQAVGAADSEWHVDPQFAEQFSAKRLQAKQAMADAFQSGRNPAEAQGVYYKTLGIHPGSQWNAPGMIGRAFGGQPGFKAPGGAAAPAGAAPTVTPQAGDFPPEAAARVKEGAVTTFANGQSWTRQNGVLVRVR